MDLKTYLNPVLDVLAATDMELILEVANRLEYARWHDKTVFWIGNGGSLSNISHMAFDITKEHARVWTTQRRLKSIALDNTGWITAIANDISYEKVFSEQIKTLGRQGDTLIALSGSGNSSNIVNAAIEATGIGMVVIGFTGFTGGCLKDFVHCHLNAPLGNMGLIESIHLTWLHMILDTWKGLLTHE